MEIQNKLNYYYNCFTSMGIVERIQEFKKQELKQKKRLFGTMFFKINYKKYIDSKEYNFINTLYHNNFSQWEKYVMKDYYNYLYMFFKYKDISIKKKCLCFLCHLYFLIKQYIIEIKEEYDK